ncbi:class I SAM-dependent methyltransferase [Nocardia sp. KC 131]|uniref:class I SAM-dependent methyltransferase n=1 Tax=Nocardia arseniciresistens TaxID=3392119 RepID=UPI00398EEDE4
MPIDGVAVTAIGVAVIRARESERPDRLYDDPMARVFVDAAQRGSPRSAGNNSWCWPMSSTRAALWGCAWPTTASARR